MSGLRAGFACDGLDPQEAQLRSGLHPRDAVFGVAPPGRVGDTPVELEPGRYVDFYARARDWAAPGAPPPVDPADSVRVLEVLEAVRRSAAHREVVRLG